MLRALAAALFALVFTSSLALAQTAPPPNPDNILVIELRTGKVMIELLPKIAPKHVERIKLLAREHFYDGLVFHRVIPGFMAQTGDPTGTGSGGSKYPDLKAEFTMTPFERGTLGAARTNRPDTANSQFFITFQHTPHLNGNYTVFGRVIEGMTYVDDIKKGDRDSGHVDGPDEMLKVYILADVQKKS